MSKTGVYVIACVCFAPGLALATVLFGGCTATQRKAVAAIADSTCVLLLDTGAPGAVERVCEAEQALYPVVQDAIAEAHPATVKCAVSPDVAPVLALRPGLQTVEVPRRVLVRVRALRAEATP